MVISVFADAQLLYSLITGNASFLDEHVRYLYKKQLEEADILIVNKIDLVGDAELLKVKEQIDIEYAGKTVLYQNSLDENSVRNWVLSLIRFESQKDRTALELDYDLYAKGEAILGWVDQKITIETKNKSAYSVARHLVHKIYRDIKKANYQVAHLKFLFDDGLRKFKISYTALDDVSSEIFLIDNRANKISILLNARIQAAASTLEELVSEAVLQIGKEAGCKIVVDKKAAFQPGYPRPVHRMG